jgi:sporulation protein YlmC with PRC-barrel domain
MALSARTSATPAVIMPWRDSASAPLCHKEMNMRRRATGIVMLVICGWLLTTATFAQEGSTSAPPPSASLPEATLLRSSFLFSYQVRSPQGEDLGKIEEIIIDMELGRVAYAMLSFGGFLGLGNKWVPVPWDALVLQADKKVLVLKIDKEKIQKAPNFEPTTLPDLANRQWGAVIHTYYGYPPYWEKQP